MKVRDAKEVLKIVKETDVRFIHIWFTDVLGFLKGFTITAGELEGALEDGMGFDGSSIEGFARIEESDMIARPDPTTFQIMPWKENDAIVARLFADIFTPDGKPFAADPRYILRKNLERVGKMGYTYYIGPELEFFYFSDNQSTKFLDRGGYFDLTTLDMARSLRKQTITCLESLGIEVEYSHHEVAPSQHEIDLRYKDAMTMADQVMTYRFVVKEVAQLNNCYATFMPKPVFGINGSGMHTHQSLFKGDKNAFFDSKGKYHLSGVAGGFIAGILHHAREITSVLNQWVNSYKRLVPGYEAPVYITWAQRNRSSLVRVPMYKPGKEKATRIEFRSPDPACNPYLAFSVMLAAGLEGMEKGYKLQDPVPHNIYEMSDEDRRKLKIENLPEDLLEAIHITEKSELVKKTLGEELFAYFIRNKKIEWDEYKGQISQYELDKYLPIL